LSSSSNVAFTSRHFNPFACEVFSASILRARGVRPAAGLPASSENTRNAHPSAFVGDSQVLFFQPRGPPSGSFALFGSENQPSRVGLPATPSKAAATTPADFRPGWRRHAAARLESSYEQRGSHQNHPSLSASWQRSISRRKWKDTLFHRLETRAAVSGPSAKASTTHSARYNLNCRESRYLKTALAASGGWKNPQASRFPELRNPTAVP